MNRLLSRLANFVWYQDVFIATWLTGFTMLFIDFVRFRRFLYRKGWLKSTRLAVPVIVVGNLTVGGTGKTPLTIALAQHLRQVGYRPGIISRGYGGKKTAQPLVLTADSVADEVGDEAILLYRQSGCPVVVAANRVMAAQWLLQHTDCNLIVADDGLQHYALQRTVEIAVIDGERRFGNANCLPGGPLREPLERLKEVHFKIVNGTATEEDEIAMFIQADSAIQLTTGQSKPLTEFSQFPCHAVAGIGYPPRFFNLLTQQGLTITAHAFPDHHRFKPKDLIFKPSYPVLMTEKDAVKCQAFAQSDYWYVPITVKLPDHFFSQLLALLAQFSKS